MIFRVGWCCRRLAREPRDGIAFTTFVGNEYPELGGKALAGDKDSTAAETYSLLLVAKNHVQEILWVDPQSV